MKISIKNTLLFAFFGIVALTPHIPLEAAIKTVFWSKPSLFYQNRGKMLWKLGPSSLMGLGRDVQNELFTKLVQHFGSQTQQYKANDPENNKPLPLIMRKWLTGEESAHDIRHAARKTFANDSFITKITDIVFKPEELVKVTSVLEDSFKLLERVKKSQPSVRHILASNYDPASFHELQKSAIGKRVLPNFNAIYNSGTLKDELKGLVLQDPAFFSLIMKEQHLQPEECLVINTDPAVISAAQSLGMKTIQYKDNDFSFVKNELKRMGLIS